MRGIGREVRGNDVKKSLRESVGQHQRRMRVEEWREREGGGWREKYWAWRGNGQTEEGV